MAERSDAERRRLIGSKPNSQQRAPGDGAAARDADHLADVLGVALAEVGHDLVAHRVELGLEGVDLLAGEVGCLASWSFSGDVVGLAVG